MQAPQACQAAFSVARDVPACSGARDGSCLTPAQKDTLAQVQAGGKAANGQPIYLPEREAAVLKRLRRLNSGPLSGEAVQRIFRQVIEESRRIEHGPEETDPGPSASH